MLYAKFTAAYLATIHRHHEASRLFSLLTVIPQRLNDVQQHAEESSPSFFPSKYGLTLHQEVMFLTSLCLTPSPNHLLQAQIHT